MRIHLSISRDRVKGDDKFVMLALQDRQGVIVNSGSMTRVPEHEGATRGN